METFGYDNLNRLTNAAGKAITYAANGNITSMGGVGTMDYGNTAKPYQVTMLTPTGDAVPEREQTVTYTSFQRPNTLVENNYKAAFTYNAAGDRARMQVTQSNNALLTRYYIGGQYELDAETNTERLYLGGDAYSAPAVYVKEAGNGKMYYICRDYLGSITHIANADGSLKQELSYDAWGRLRDPATQVAYAPGSEPASFLVRGYTGHEHLVWFGLVNMNARLYDAALGRFLSPDPYVQMIDFSQNFNRYSYCLNNPLILTDENGELFGIDDLIAALIGGVVNWIGNGCQFNNQGLVYFGVGLVGGWTSLYTTPAGGGAIMSGMNSTVRQGFGSDGKWNWNDISIKGVLFDTAIGGATAQIGAYLSNQITPFVNKFTSQLGGKAIQQMTTQGITGSATGFTISTGASLLEGDNLETALGKGWGGAKSGWIAGSIGGLGSGLREAYKVGENPWTGKEIQSKTDSYIVTPDGVILPKGATIPDNYIENPNITGSYGIIEDGKFIEKLRIDPGTAPGTKGTNESHFHLNGNRKHIFDMSKWPGWK
jgi:RHS repeat-associated protein